MLDLLKFSGPLIFMLVAQNAMSMVDLYFVGKIGQAASAAVSLGNALFSWVMVMGIGLLSGADYYIARSFGEGKGDLARGWLLKAILMAVLLGIFFGIPVFGMTFFIDGLGVSPEVAHYTRPYMQALSLSLIPMYLGFVCRVYVQAIGQGSTLYGALIVANVINIALNALWVPPTSIYSIGIVGSAIATTLARIAIVAATGYVAWLAVRQKPIERVPSTLPMLKLGAPSAGQLLLEVGVFSLATALVAKMSSKELAAHGIVLNIAATAFMIPLGIGGSTAIKIAEAIGAGRDPKPIGNRALGLGVLIMFITATMILGFPDFWIGFFTEDSEVITHARKLLFWAGLFQIFDGAQAVLTGVLRGAGNTKFTLYANAIGHWLIGLPVGFYLGFKAGFGATGIWIGLATGLFCVATALYYKWSKHSKLLAHSNANALSGAS